MGLKVVSGGVELNVSGVDQDTTCLQVVYALAHATNQKGKFVLVAYFNGTEHRLSHNEKPLDFVSQYERDNVPVTFELRHLEPQLHSSRPQTSNMEVTSCNMASVYATATQSYSQSSLPPSITQSSTSPYNKSSNNSLGSSGKTISLPPGGFSLNSSLELSKKPRPPPPTYNEVIGQRCNSLSRDMSKSLTAALASGRRLSTSSSLSQIEIPNSSLSDDFVRFSRHDLEKIIQQQNQFILHQKSQLLNIDVTLSNSSERELVQLKKQHNNLLTVLNSLRNANWPLRLAQEEQEAERLERAIEEMKTFVDRQKNELMGLLQKQHVLETQLDNYSDAETISQPDDSQYWSITDYSSNPVS